MKRTLFSRLVILLMLLCGTLGAFAQNTYCWGWNNPSNFTSVGSLNNEQY